MLEASDTSTPELLGKAVSDYVKKVWTQCSSVVFNGDGYSDEWQAEAARRGLPNLVTTPDAVGVIKEQRYTDLFAKYGVLSERELDSRYEVYAEQYVHAVNVESNLVVEMARTMVLPAAVRYQGELASSLANLKAIGIESDHTTILQVTDLIGSLQDSVAELVALKANENDAADVSAHCHFVKDLILPKMLEIRKAVDALEDIVADDLWPLPTYQEMLFIR